MTTIASNYTEARFSKSDSALLLIGHQSGIMQLNRDYSPAEFRNNVIALAKIGKIFDLPTVISSSYETGPNGPIIQELLDMHPTAPVIRRPGQISAWDNEDFVAAVKATGRKNLIMAGVTVEVCLAYPAMQAAAEGFNVYGVIDAFGAPDAATREMTLHRLVVQGITPVTWLMVAAELQRDWRLRPARGWRSCSMTTFKITRCSWTTSRRTPGRRLRNELKVVENPTMVRRDAMNAEAAFAAWMFIARCAFSAGASPAI